MRFKNWLITEDFHASDSNQIGDALYPTNAGDYAYAANDPSEHSWLQWKWDQEKKEGRKFFNIDQEEFDKRGYVALKSLTMPDDRWKHRSEQRPNISVVQVKDLSQVGIGKDSKDHNQLSHKKMIQWILPLDQIFKDKPSGKWPEASSDKRWR